MLTARAATAHRRQRLLATIGNEPEAAGDEPPNRDSIEIMSAIDRLPVSWRALVYEYGFTRTLELRSGMDAIDAGFELLMQRENKQREWLMTDFFLRKRA